MTTKTPCCLMTSSYPIFQKGMQIPALKKAASGPNLDTMFMCLIISPLISPQKSARSLLEAWRALSGPPAFAPFHVVPTIRILCTFSQGLGVGPVWAVRVEDSTSHWKGIQDVFPIVLCSMSSFMLWASTMSKSALIGMTM